MAIDLKLKGESYAKQYDILDNNINVGYISLRENDDTSVSVESIFIHINYQKQGIGRKVINKLKENYSFIYGASSPMAIDFWKKVGAEFEYPIINEMIYTLLNMGEYPPFMIKC